MKNHSYINRVGKRTPYSVPNDFFSAMEKNILNRVADEPSSDEKTTFPIAQKKSRTWKKVSLLSAAAAIAVLLILTFTHTVNTEATANDAAIESAFNNLSTADQDYLLTVYADDVFFQEP